jgi:hypothetical protein
LISYPRPDACELGVIRLERTTPRRGALEHHYRATIRARVGWPSPWTLGKLRRSSGLPALRGPRPPPRASVLRPLEGRPD